MKDTDNYYYGQHPAWAAVGAAIIIPCIAVLLIIIAALMTLGLPILVGLVYADRVKRMKAGKNGDTIFPVVDVS